MNALVETSQKSKPANAPMGVGTALGCSRDFLGQRFVYTVISARAHGLSVGVNLTPDKQCNFDCVYCEVARSTPVREAKLDLEAMAAELEATLGMVRANPLPDHLSAALRPPELLRLRHVAISGDGEPTLCPQFRDAVETVIHVRAQARVPFFKIVLITNASNLDAPEVQEGLRLLTLKDEIWAKLDAGTQASLERVNKTEVPLEKILSNILLVAQRRPVIIQSLFPAWQGRGPDEAEIASYVQRLKELKDAGAQIPLVQIYSATRPTPRSECSHLPLRVLSQIAHTVRAATGLNAEVF